MKRIPDLLILLPILLLLLGATTRIVDAAIVRGDSDASGVVDIADPVSTMMCLYLAAACADCQDSADANDDGAVDLVDVLHTLFFLFEGTPALPPPYPDPGIDTTPDDFPCGADLPTLPDVSGTFVPENDMEYVVIFQVEDTESGATIVTGLESIANEIFDGEIFVWNDGTDLNWGLNYLTSFDIVEGDIMSLEVDEDLGGGFMEGTFNTTSGYDRDVLHGAYLYSGDAPTTALTGLSLLMLTTRTLSEDPWISSLTGAFCRAISPRLPWTRSRARFSDRRRQKTRNSEFTREGSFSWTVTRSSFSGYWARTRSFWLAPMRTLSATPDSFSCCRQVSSAVDPRAAIYIRGIL